jgi:hypothetical protein
MPMRQQNPAAPRRPPGVVAERPAAGRLDAATLAELGSEDLRLDYRLGMEGVWAHLPGPPRRVQHLLALRFTAT